jgi:hypothetical protein
MLKTRQENIDDASRQERADKLFGPGHFVYPPKTTLSITSYRQAEVFSLQQLLNYIHEWSTKIHESYVTIAIQGKYDGNSCYLQRTSDGKFFVFTEDASEVSDRVPHLIAKAKKELPNTDYIILGELENWPLVDGKRVHQGREFVAGSLHSAGPAEDQNYVWNIHDCIWFDGKDLHNETYEVRWETVEKNFKIRQSVFTAPNPGFNICPTSICNSDAQVTRVIDSIARFEWLEGAMVKRWDGYKFSLNGRTTDMVKFKKYAECHVWVIDKKMIRGGAGNTFQYRVALEVLPSEATECDPQALIDFQGKKAMPVAHSFNTNVVAKIGDVITMVFHDMYVTKNANGKIRITLYEPRVYENRTIADPGELPDTVTTLMKIGTDAQLISYKSLDFIPFELVKQMSVFEQYPDETSTYKFVIQNHWRGSTVHGDLRLESINHQYLLGYTLDIQVPGKAPSVTTLPEAQSELNNKELWKFNAHTGVFLPRQTRGGLKQATSIVVELKEPEPGQWLTFQGVVQPGGVGSTRGFPGVFVIAAQGNVEYGFRNGYFHEYFFHCETWQNGGQRLVFRQLATDFDDSSGDTAEEKGFEISHFLKWMFETTEPITNYVVLEDSITCDWGDVYLPERLVPDYNGRLIIKETLTPSDVPSIRTPTMWMMIKPNNQIPYIISRRAVKNGRMTPYGVSALPRGVRVQIPHEYQYWTFKSPSIALKVRQELVDAITKKQVKIDFDFIYKKTQPAEEKSLVKDGLEKSFILNRRTWRGPIVIRVGYSAEIYDLWIDMGDFIYLFSCNQDPRTNSVTGTLKKVTDKSLMEKVGEQPPGSELNPNKKIPVTIDRLQEGKLTLLIDNPDVKKIEVKTPDWKGLFLFEQDANTNIWSISETSSVGGPEDNSPS